MSSFMGNERAYLALAQDNLRNREIHVAHSHVNLCIRLISMGSELTSLTAWKARRHRTKNSGSRCSVREEDQSPDYIHKQGALFIDRISIQEKVPTCYKSLHGTKITETRNKKT